MPYKQKMSAGPTCNCLRQAQPGSLSLSLRPVDWQRDLQTMLAIERAGFAHPWHLEKFLRFCDTPSNQAVIAETHDDVAGYMLIENSGRLHVAHIAVAPHLQSMGIGRRLLMSVLDSEQTVSLYVRESNVRAQALYHSLGFHFVQLLPAHYEDAESAVVMEHGGQAARALLSSPKHGALHDP